MPLGWLHSIMLNPAYSFIHENTNFYAQFYGDKTTVKKRGSHMTHMLTLQLLLLNKKSTTFCKINTISYQIFISTKYAATFYETYI
jgi:hypothetical protein